MRWAHTGVTSPMLRYRAVKYGNASFDTSTSATARSTSRAFGPHRPSANNDPADRDVHAFPLADLRAQEGLVVMTRPAARHNAEPARSLRVTVRSSLMPPRSVRAAV